jgi:opacity protein-like surface antigen
MKRVTLGFVFLVSAALCNPGTASAQGTGGFQFGLSGGADFPISDQKDVYKTGWNGTALVAINFGTAPVGIRIDGSYHELKTQTDLQAFFLGDGRTRIISGTADLVIGPRNRSVEPYIIGGVGAYDLRFRGQDITTGNAFSQSTTRFGWNAGVGLAFPLGTGSKSRFFVEGRYTSVTVDADRFSNSVHRGGTRFTFVPVNAGFIF